MASERKYTNRGKAPIVIGDVTIKPGATVQLDETSWAEADERAGLYRDFRETVEQVLELVN